MTDSLATETKITPEGLMLQATERLAKNCDRKIALHIRISRLQPQNRREHHVRTANNAFREQLAQYQGQIFQLRNEDIVMIGQVEDIRHIDSALIRLRCLFEDDPLVSANEGYSNDEYQFASWYNLSEEYDRFLSDVKQMYRMTNTGVPIHLTKQEIKKPVIKTRQPLSPTGLGNLEKLLSKADLTNLVRNQPICMLDEQVPKVIFNERYTSIMEIQQVITPDHELTANHWLFMSLTQTLDKRMLVYLTKELIHISEPFSVNLNVSTLLSTEFEEFDKVVTHRLKNKLVIEIQMLDAFSDVKAFIFARDFLRERGYKVCLDGISAAAFPLLDRDQMGVDLIKLIWNTDMQESIRPRFFEKLQEKIARGRSYKVILTRCDDENAVSTGKSLGVDFFQGRHIDSLIRENGYIKK